MKLTNKYQVSSNNACFIFDQMTSVSKLSPNFSTRLNSFDNTLNRRDTMLICCSQQASVSIIYSSKGKSLTDMFD